MNTGSLAARLWRDWLTRYPGVIIGAIILSAITAGAASSYAFVVRFAAGLLENPTADNNGLWIAAGALIAATSIRAISLYFQTLATNTLALSVMRDLQSALFGHLITADFARLTREPVGALISRFTNDINMMREGLVRAANNLLRDSLIVIGCLAAMIYIDWALTLVVFGVLVAAGIPVIQIGQRIRKRADAVQAQMGDVSSFLEESFSGARMVKTFTLEDWVKTRAHVKFSDRLALLLSMIGQRARIDPIMEASAGVALAVLFGFGGWRAMQGETNLSDLIGIITAMGVMASAARSLASLSGVLQEAFAVLDRVFAILDEKPRIQSALSAPKLNIDRGAVRFDQVGFSYGAERVIDGLSLNAKPGETVALVGPSGSGKSTLINLVARLYDVDEGTVFVDGQDVRSVSLDSLRQQISLVSQDVTIFDDTVRANIAIGRPDASDDDVIAAARAADAHDFIVDMAEGYNSPAGPKGSNLSGGQRQRIAIARALLKNAPILLLDEATSALDAGSESRVQEALDRLSEGRTTLVIAHRLSTVRRADQIFVLDKGRIVEQGDHSSLMAKNGLYAELSQLQFKSSD